ncbi:MAG: helix-turn-helix domain-containing protein, partial [Propionibacteriaceae bacterium]
MPHYRISEAAELLGVSDDTVRRWIEAGRVPAGSGGGPRTIEGADLAALAQELPQIRAAPGGSSARNRFTGLVTKVTVDAVMAQVELQCGAFRVVSLLSAEAV